MELTKEELYNPLNQDGLENFEKERLEENIRQYVSTRDLIKKGIEYYQDLAHSKKIWNWRKRNEYKEWAEKLEAWSALLDEYEFTICDMIEPDALGWLKMALSFEDENLKNNPSASSIIYLACYSRLTGKTPEEILNGYTIEDVIRYEEEQELSGKSNDDTLLNNNASNRMGSR